MKQWNRGYHYTSLDNWKSIVRNGGIQPYHIKQDKLYPFFPNGVEGIFVWTNKQIGKAHMGSLIYQLSSKGTHELVVLEVFYPATQTLTYKGQNIKLTHHGNIDKYIYHGGDDEAVIVTSGIPITRVRKIEEYNLADLLNRDRK